MYLDFVHEVDTVSKVTAQGTELDASRWNLRGSAGLEIRNYNPWNLRIQAEYIPVNNNIFRDTIAQQIALMYIGYPSTLLPQATGVQLPSAGAGYNFTMMELQTLGRLDTRQMVIRLPDRTFVKPESGENA